jgi:hypothetical protein
MVYRSPVLRWFLALMALATGVIFTFGDGAKWRSTPSLHWLAASRIPLQLWGVLTIAYGLMLLTSRLRSAGFALGAGIYALFTISLLATVFDGQPKNVYAVSAMALVVAFHLYSIRTAFDVVAGEKARRK